MKHNNPWSRISIKWRIFACFVGFAAIILAFLWVFQIAFLDTFYSNIKISEIKSVAQEVEKHIDSEDLQDSLIHLAIQKQVSIVISDEMGHVFYSVSTMPNSWINERDSLFYMQVYAVTQQAGGSFLQNSLDTQWGNRKNQNIDTLPATLVHANLVETQSGKNLLILLNSELSPVKATVETLRVQLAWITLIMLVLALLIAFFLSRWISFPIIRINQSAKALARSKYDVNFEEVGYKEIVELAKTLNYAAKELSKVEQLQRELIANISHDLRTPLTMIAGYSEVMRDIPGENTPENIQVIIDEANRLTTLVNDVLDISKLQSGTLAVNMVEFNLTGSVQEILSRYNKLIDYNIRFLAEEDVWVMGDELKLSQVVYNLVNNAITYTGKDKTVTIAQVFPQGQKDRIRIEVKDTGEGLEANQLKDIWNRYYKVDKAHKRAQIGTGLGLSIVKMILDLHAGASYGVRSTPGKGSTFWFELNTIKTIPAAPMIVLEEKKDE